MIIDEIVCFIANNCLIQVISRPYSETDLRTIYSQQIIPQQLLTSIFFSFKNEKKYLENSHFVIGRHCGKFRAHAGSDWLHVVNVSFLSCVALLVIFADWKLFSLLLDGSFGLMHMLILNMSASTSMLFIRTRTRTHLHNSWAHYTHSSTLLYISRACKSETRTSTT